MITCHFLLNDCNKYNDHQDHIRNSSCISIIRNIVKGQIVNVSDGYARNMILPKKLGLEATPKNLNDLKLQKANEEKVAKEVYEAAQAFAKDLETKEIILTLKTGEGGRTFGSVSSKEISEAAKKQLNLDIDKKKLQLPEPIRTLGVTQVPVRLHPKVTGTLKVWVKEA